MSSRSSVTWAAASVIALLVPIFLYLYPNRRSRRTHPSTMSNAEFTVTASAPEKPKDGDVRVSKILIHPIKSCRGTSVESAKYTPTGIENDRLWSIMDATTVSIITAREFPKMVLITPRIEKDESSSFGGFLTLTFPEDSGCEPFSVPLRPTKEILDAWEIIPEIMLWKDHAPIDGYICQSITSSATSPSSILSKYFGKPVHLLYKGPRPRVADTTTLFPDLKANSMFQDMYPLLVLSEESMGDIDKETQTRIGAQGISDDWRDKRIPIERFRPNLVFSGGGPFAEDMWEEISIGSADAPKVTLVSKCARCLLPNVDPVSGVKDQAVPYKVLMKFRTGIDLAQKMKPCVGCNGVPDASGEVKVGDVVYVKKMLRTV